MSYSVNLNIRTCVFRQELSNEIITFTMKGQGHWLRSWSVGIFAVFCIKLIFVSYCGPMNCGVEIMANDQNVDKRIFFIFTCMCRVCENKFGAAGHRSGRKSTSGGPTNFQPDLF